MPVRIRDIGSVASATAPNYTVVTANGKPAVLVSINRQPNSNTVQVADEVHQEIESLRRTLPGGINLNVFYDQSDIVRDSIASVRDAIIIGLGPRGNDHLDVPARLGHRADDRHGDSRSLFSSPLSP